MAPFIGTFTRSSERPVTRPTRARSHDAPQPDAPPLELRCGAIASGGGCVARASDGRVVFVRHALPGELVLARLTSQTSSFARADAVEVIEPAPARVAPPCSHAGPGRCGGCDWQHIAPTEQRRLKAELVSEQLRRVAGVDRSVEVEEVAGSSDGLGWRTRVRFAVDREGRVGLRRHRSHDIELIEHCPVSAQSVEDVSVEQHRWLGAAELEVFAADSVGELVNEQGARSTVVVLTPGRNGIRRRDIPQLATPNCGLVAEDEVLRPPGSVTVPVGDHLFKVSAGAFWQVHRGAPSTLGRAVLDGLAAVPGETVLDLYAGVGLFSVLIGTAVGETGTVVAVERDRRACADLRHNSSDLPQVSVRAATVSPDLVESLQRPDLVVLDPPREGAGRPLMFSLAALQPAPRRIAYVSCDAATFARDVAVLFSAGWTMPSLRAFDLFPMTEHVELVAILQPPEETSFAPR